MKLRRLLFFAIMSVLIAFGHAVAWGPDGHHTVGGIADQLIAGTPAADHVKELLGGISLEDAAVWADCAKGIDPAKDYTYTVTGRYRECKIYENPQGEAEMSDFVRRNDKNCNPNPGDESCHKQYHYTDVAIQHDKYDRKFVGTRDDDLVNATIAAIHVLKGEPCPSPFKFKDKREALLVLVHYVGDVHQPLHVGAIYLSKNGKIVNPDSGNYDPMTDTHGGNKIKVSGKTFHSKWDGVPKSLAPAKAIPALIGDAKGISVTGGDIYSWPILWAGDTLVSAKQAFEGVQFSSFQNGHWNAVLPQSYSKRMNNIKKQQVTKAGAHLAQLLQAIWP